MMLRVVIDTNVLVSGVILPSSRTGGVILHLRRGKLTPLYCIEMLEELAGVLTRPRIRDKYHVTDADIRAIIDLILLKGEIIRPADRISESRDPKDDIFLSVAVAGQADLIVSGVDDLLSLDPFRGISIIGPAAFVGMIEREDSG